MITRFYIDNFKSLVNFDLELSKFTCLIGLNGAGKSTVLQALDFASVVMSGDIDSWLEKRKWDVNDVKSSIVQRNNISIKVGIRFDGMDYRWDATFNRIKRRCIKERLGYTYLSKEQRRIKVLFKVENNTYTVRKTFSDILPPLMPINFKYKGSILSQITPDSLGETIISLKNNIASLRSLDLLSPQLLRQKSRKTDKNDIGMGGEQLSAFIHQLTDEQKNTLVQQLRTYYPKITSVQTKTLRSGWVQLEVVEKYTTSTHGEQEVRTEAKHINDGMLRLLAVLAQQFSPLETLLFDEIENGINPEVIEKVVDALVASPKQIIVTTHSPMLLNYMTDEVAKEAVMLIYKRADGSTHATRFFDIPSAAQKLESLPPGAAMLDVYLDQVAQEAEHHHAA